MKVSPTDDDASLEHRIQVLTNELSQARGELMEAREQQAATGEILRVISRSPMDLLRAFEEIAASAARLCDANDATILQVNGDLLRLVAHHGPLASLPLGSDALPLTRGLVTGRAVLDRRTVQVADLPAETIEFPAGSEMARRLDFHTNLAVPLMRGGEAIGVINIRRTEVRPFTDRQIFLLNMFADQAVIAIENTRLFEKVQARTRELQQALEYQSASSDVLKVISRSGAELGPVLDTLVETAGRICRADSGFIFRLQNGVCHMIASFGVPSEYRDFQLRSPIALGRGTLAGRTVLERRPVHIEDAAIDPEYTRIEAVQLGRQRTMLGVPLVREDALIGVITLARSRVEPFAQQQIDLVTTFAHQAVIAIENARLFGEVRARTWELARSLEELKALGEVSQAVNSTLKLEKVLATIVAHACEISDSGGGAIYVFDRAMSAFVLEASRNMSEELISMVRAHPIHLGETPVGQCAERREAVQIPDLAKAPPHPLFAMHLKAGVRALLAVPLLHQDEVVGALVVRRKRVGTFTPENVNLLQSFASQSAIAIQNARLFEEIEDKSRQLEIASQHKSHFVANMSHELRTPLAAMLGYAELLRDGVFGELPVKSIGIIERVQANGKHLLGLINTVLDISKIEAGQFKLSLGEYSIDSMVHTVRVATESLASAKKLSFRTEVAQGLPYGLGDEPRLTQVLLNLVGNAIKFTEAGEVCISGGAKDNSFIVTVSDTGPGIPYEERERIFHKFHQVDSTTTKAKGGTGLGLAIAKEIIEMHGGRIWVDSTVGRGSTFRVELPVHAQASQATV